MFNNWEIFLNYKNFTINQEIKDKLNLYYQILIDENQKYNLTRITELNEVFEKHFLDSLLFVEHFKINDQKIADIGTGAGFPGVVLKIFFPNIKLTLIESNNKKANFLKYLVDKLELNDVEILNKRAEELTSDYKEKFDIVISRAVAYLDIILELGVQLVKVDGSFILLKGPKAFQEIDDLKNKDKKMNLKLVDVQQLQDTGFGTRINLFYKKIGSTSSLYPRKYQQILKESK
ncbi:16S rRNA (guanine(527)-N(7))-methyltransferase RsmG [Mycoplasma feriruminatoris]|uniref:16S rRNA (guanine(527)-N(7))-methyltransferase RsmG n=1 Tax=Mycoplasma feriruminatoris TaxID=1179777 RepID=UPI0002A4DC9A|nr:16S rRNA (guanine(527)-N(7))-methyltransferase RsmG [Mycoplasma feriruminatoris]UKS54508.1 16S rRNA (guanine(527)-N(7))-methyltransferase GidB [Mycoplasma feriruminatoris]VZK65683.1 Ribosomal RNA small subunit methyltransferase G [Mycoplasma feriruminatoris]VZR75827.1 Ribosomal RNA small subunit methyltransferase G [Mycoplasma feriruminatoris]VZR98578.1 Ribosomal RNA small subunit methyltransferase G [Mycoplasma feriruminatoris]